MKHLFAVVDAFADRPFGGNPAGVCLLSETRDADWMQAVARELGVPATAFVARGGDGYDLRWFSMTTELTLCGHATLASAHLLWQQGETPDGDPIRFRSPAGALACSHHDGWIAMDFPAEPARAVAAPPTDLIRALGVRPRFVGRNRLDYLVELDSEEAVRAVRPDLVTLARATTRGVMVTAAVEGAGHDFVSRFFAPAVGIDEDGVTGSAHCCLGPFWGERLGKDDLVGYQASARGGTVRVGVRGQRVELRGRAVTVLRGELAV